ncbi:MAG TPA: AtpZ/AtpI family protein [Candidatus Omnitrophota bacterium]|nr:AtpZ/AtpI family protein [Candidatus Omnitrophota bacterium]
MSESSSKEFYKLIKQLGTLTLIPTLLVSGPLAGFFLGRWMDRKFGMESCFVYVWIVIGFLASARESYRIIKKVSDEK